MYDTILLLHILATWCIWTQI